MEKLTGATGANKISRHFDCTMVQWNNSLRVVHNCDRSSLDCQTNGTAEQTV